MDERLVHVRAHSFRCPAQVHEDTANAFAAWRWTLSGFGACATMARGYARALGTVVVDVNANCDDHDDGGFVKTTRPRKLWCDHQPHYQLCCASKTHGSVRANPRDAKQPDRKKLAMSYLDPKRPGCVMLYNVDLRGTHETRGSPGRDSRLRSLR